jgi:lactoylglutathione lyase
MEIDYIALFVVDVDRSIAFYRDVLGIKFPKPPKHGGAEGLSGNLKIGIYDRSWLDKLFGDRPEISSDITRNSHAFLLSMPVSDLEAFYQMLVVAEVEVISPPQTMPWGQTIVFFKDPDGNLLEAVQR